MGITDTRDLFNIYDIIKKLDHDHEWGFTFEIDSDTKRAGGLMINEYGDVITGDITQEEAHTLRSLGYRRFVPDLIEYHYKGIIEYQEEQKPTKGASLGTKGHSELSDSDKDLFYTLGGFEQLKIWESDTEETTIKNIRSFLGHVFSLNHSSIRQAQHLKDRKSCPFCAI